MHYNETNHMFEIVNLFLLQACPVYIVDDVFFCFLSLLCIAGRTGKQTPWSKYMFSGKKKNYQTLIHGILIL